MGLLDQLNEVLVQQPRKYWGDKATRLGSLLSDSAAMYGSANSPIAQEHANTLAGLLADFTPVVGDVKSAYEGLQSAREGDYLGAALGGLGALPLVPNLAGVFKPTGKLRDAIIRDGFDPEMAMSHGMRGELKGGWFDPLHYGKSDSGYAGRGTYGTQLDSVADTYSRGGDGANVVPIIPRKGSYVDIQNAKGDENPYIWINDQVQAAMKRGENWKEAQEKASKEWTKMMQARGYIGTVDKDNGKITQAAIFDPKDIRSPFSFK